MRGNSHVRCEVGENLEITSKDYLSLYDYMDLQRFAENTRHMIIFDVLTHDSPVGWKGERTRLFLSEIGYEKALDSQAKGQIKILSHAKVRNGDLFYDHKEQIR